MYWDNLITFTYETDYAANHPNLSAKVFMSVGSLEGSEGNNNSSTIIADIQTLTERLLDREYDDLELKTHIFEEETHYSIIPATISKGLKAVFGELPV